MGTNIPPKRRNKHQTRAKVLEAACTIFSERGFAQTGIREVAALAGVTSPMVLRYFGSKAGLFEAALAHLMDLSVIFNWRKSEIGENLASIFSGDGLDPKPSVPVMVASMIALSTSDQEARDIAARVAAEHVIDPTAGWLGPPDAHSRAAQLFLLSTGFVLYMHAIPVLRGKKEADAQMADWFRRTVQEIVDQVEIDPVRT